MGTRALYDWLEGEGRERVRFLPVDAVNDPALIARNRSMVSINGALSVDLVGQVVADQIGGRQYSGIGGHEEFVRGPHRLDRRRVDYSALGDDELQEHVAFDAGVCENDGVLENPVRRRLAGLVHLATEVSRSTITRPRGNRIRAAHRCDSLKRGDGKVRRASTSDREKNTGDVKTTQVRTKTTRAH